MLKKIPISAPYVTGRDLLFSLKGLFNSDKAKMSLKQSITSVYDPEFIFLLNSGIACFLVILESLKRLSDKKEVIVPAYTAGSLVAAIQKAGLKPVLCDVSLRDFNMSLDSLPKLVSENTLCVVGVHLFAMAAYNLNEIKEQFPDIYLIEDCAQSMGSKIDDQYVGNVGDVSFFSLNRGKNFSTYGGGFIITDQEKLAAVIKDTIFDLHLKRANFSDSIRSFFKMLILNLVVNSYVYAALYFLLFRFKEVAVPTDIEVADYSNLQAQAASIFLRRFKDLSEIRYNNGMRIIEGLKGVEGIILPQIADNTKPAFNRLPLVFKDTEKRDQIEEALSRAGIETSRMYIKPLHEMFNLGYQKDELP
ncbi:MAG: DegT/DnrJ/EryC1/StrS family aminotransferase, partial [Candidatus Omnitrophica bacterium]|nr:DegT/DnrJ/EryC1/StrS family aminotransferase [Candidatus Omnitrophota bacterium]